MIQSLAAHIHSNIMKKKPSQKKSKGLLASLLRGLERGGNPSAGREWYRRERIKEAIRLA